MDLLCPKCHNLMNAYERNGVVVDQCTECKGLFLDRGELEKLVSAESAWYGDSGRPATPAPAYAPDDRRHDRRYDDDRRHDDRRYDDRYRKKKRRGSFLEDLLDFD